MTPLQDAYTEVADEDDEIIYILADSGKLIPATFWKARPQIIQLFNNIGMAQIFPIDFEEKLTMAQDDYILFSDSEDGNKIKKAQYKNLKGEKGDP